MMEIKKSEKNDGEGSLKDSLRKSIRCKPDEYKLIFHSKSILFSQAISDYLYDELKVQKTTTLLVDLSEEEVDQIFNQIVCKKSLQLLQNPKKQTKFETKRLNQITKQKRTWLYKTTGVYSLSSQVFLKDLIRFQKIIELKSINRIIIRISQRITSYLNKLGWIFTLLKKQTKSCSLIILCRNIHLYSEYDHLQGLYRTFFCQKLVIWPFGRSEIHKSIQKVSQRINELKHYLDMTQQMKRNEEIIKSLLEIVQKEYNRFRTEKKNGLEILYKEWIGQQLNNQSPEIFQQKDFNNLKYLMNCIQNTGEINFLYALLKLRNNQSEKSIWNSSNSMVVDLIEEAVKNCKKKIYSIQKIQEPERFLKVNLCELIMDYHYERGENEIGDKYQEWQAFYQLQYRIKPYLHRNHKILETFECIDTILQQIYGIERTLTQNKSKKSQRISEDFMVQDQKEEQCFGETLLITCQSTFVRNYVHRQLFSKINDSHYIDYLKSLYDFLRIERELRIVNIKSVFNKIKQKAGPQKMEVQQTQEANKPKTMLQQKEQNSMLNIQKPKQQLTLQQIHQNSLLKAISLLDDEPNQEKPEQKEEKTINRPVKENNKNTKSAKQIYRENIFILEESLYRQLSILFEILPKYENLVFTDEEIRMNTSYIKKRQTQNERSKSQSFKDMMYQNNEQISVKEDSVKLVFKGQSEFYQKQFFEQIQRINFEFIDKKELKIVPRYSEESRIAFFSKTNPQKKVLIVSLFAPKGSVPVSDRVTQFNQSIKLSNPQRVIFYSPHSWQIRNLYLTASEGQLPNLKEIRVLAYKNSFEVQTAQHQVKQEDEAFWKISQNRLKLSEYKQNPELRIKELQMNDKYEKTVDFINYAIRNDPKAQQKPHIYRLSLNERRIIVDSREFKSSLPCHLFFYGFTVIPIQLQTADYIISDNIGIEKKSVRTKDLHQSLKSFRLDNQIRRMCQKFQKPYLLIECDEVDDFKRESFFYGGGQVSGAGSKDSFRTFVRQRLTELIKKFPRLRIIWSESVAKTCEYFKQLKRDQPEPQIGKYMKNENQQLEKVKALESDEQQEEAFEQEQKIKVEQ